MTTLPGSSAGPPNDSVRADDKRCVRVSLSPETFSALPHARNFSSSSLSASNRGFAAARATTVPHAGGATTTLYSGSDSAPDSIAPVTIYTAAEGKSVQFQDLWDQQNVLALLSFFWFVILKFQNKDGFVHFTLSSVCSKIPKQCCSSSLPFIVNCPDGWIPTFSGM